MRKFIVKHFALDYLYKIFGYTFNFTRSATFIFPLFCLNVILILKYGYSLYLVPTIGMLLVSLFIGFIYFRIKPIKYHELDNVQKYIYNEANNIFGGADDIDKDDMVSVNKFMEDLKNKKNYKPFLIIYHPMVLVPIVIIITYFTVL